jgi:hypothetical protein
MAAITFSTVSLPSWGFFLLSQDCSTIWTVTRHNPPIFHKISFHRHVSSHGQKIRENLAVSQIVFTLVIYFIHMKTLSLKLEDHIFNDAEGVISKINKNRNRYINEAVDYYNRYNKRKILASKLAIESKLVQNESMSVLAEFELISNED